MNTYIGLEGNKLRAKADHVIDWPDPTEAEKRAYEAHLASLPVIQAEFEVEVGREYVEDESFEKQYQIYNADKWKPVTFFIYDRYMGDNAGFKRVVALPISKQEASPEVKERRCKLSDTDLLKAVQEWVTRLCTSGGKAWMLRVPVDFERDPDILISELARRYKAVTTATPSPSPTIKSAEEVWNEACKTLLGDISTAFLDPENLKKASLNDSVVIQAIGETIKNFPIPELASQFRDSEPSK